MLRILGFRERDILLCFLAEALIIALCGGLAGTALGYAMNGLTLSTAPGEKSIAFAFQVDARAVMIGAAFTLAMGIVGGVMPAFTAMRIDPLESLR